MRGIYTIILLILSNIFMTLAWYGHLEFKKYAWFNSLSLFGIILLSWGIAFFEYTLQVPANRIGYQANGGPYNIFQLKVIQEAISLIVFSLFAIIVFKTERLAWNHILGFVFIMLAVFFIFKKW